MYCTVKEIIREVLDTDVPDSECVFAVVLTRGDVRHIAQDWSLTDDELETVMQRLSEDYFLRLRCHSRRSVRTLPVRAIFLLTGPRPVRAARSEDSHRLFVTRPVTKIRNGC